MGQKIHPLGFRLGSFRTWESRWFAGKDNFANLLLEDIEIRRKLFAKLKLAGPVKVEIERLPKSMVVIMEVARPGVVIGRGGEGLTDVKKIILSVIKKGKTKTQDTKIDLKVSEVKNVDLSARLVAERIVGELERRFPARRVVGKAIERVMAAGALGVKVVLAGRIGGAEISRVEKYKEGSVPAQTLREDIDYAGAAALLKRGYVGVKVWIHKKAEA